MLKPCTLILALAGALWISSLAEASPTGWSPVIIATGEYRHAIKSTPIHHRPNRPLHFYGNTVRRRIYGGPSLPVRRGRR
jgi:hypothetical protein